ncbi:MAG TPA: DNA-binding transcriptional regulator [Planctomycetota bacterium]|nr:DNA-binding transcriptional regulator [Planctomycetota bacterium]
MSRQLKVALLIESSNAYARGLLRGVAAYMREHRPWSVYLAEASRGEGSLGWLADWDGHGVIARVENAAVARALRGLSVPVVDVSAARKIPALPWVETDDDAIARMAAEHLLERGFRHFGYCGDDAFNWSRWRQARFESLIRSAGRSCSVYRPPAGRRAASAEAEAIAGWVRSLPRPVGVMACYDYRARQVLDACRRLGAAVPDEVAVIGVDNDEVLCELCDPPLSSVIPNTRRTGYEAAALLDRMMAGERVKGAALRIEPLGVATRLSTDVLAIDDRGVAAAVRHIREHACDGINVKDVLRAVPQSRRSLESRFRKLIGRTPHEEILRVQLGRARLLLAESELSLKQIAEQTGFAHAEYLSAVFRREVGIPPGRYRARSRPRAARAR